MTIPPPYLEGLLAAVRPDHRSAAAAPRIETPPSSAEAAVVAAGPSENFSPEERVKRHLHPLDSFGRLLDCASANRPPDADDRFRFQWFGLFYQAPEQDAFTLRVRLTGGRLKRFQLTGLASITQRFAGGQVSLNSQGGFDIPGVAITSVAEILGQIESMGLSALRTGGDCVQVVRGGELDDSPADGREDGTQVYPLVRALEQALAYGPTFSDLPLPCEIAFQPLDDPSVVQLQPSIDTIILRVPTQACLSPDEKSTSTRNDSFFLHLPGETKEGFLLPYRHVVSACLELLKAWAAGADRSSREQASLANFLTGLGPDATCALLGGAKRAALPRGSKLKSPPVENAAALGLAVPDRRLLSGQLTALGQCCREQGWREIRLLRAHLYAVGINGGILNGTAAMQKALSA